MNFATILLSRMTLLRWLTSLPGSLTVSLTVLLFWIYFGLLTLVFVLQWLSLHRIAYDYSRADWDGLRDDLRDVPWEDIFKLRASAAATEFCEWVQVGIDVYIPHHKYQFKPYSSAWFLAACAAAIVHKNHFLFVPTE